VTAGKKWAEIGRGLSYTRKQCTSMSNALKSSYLNIIMPYEIYLAKNKQASTETHSPPSPMTGVKREASTDVMMEESQDSLATPAASPPSTAAEKVPTRRSKRIKKDPISYSGKSLCNIPLLSCCLDPARCAVLTRRVLRS